MNSSTTLAALVARCRKRTRPQQSTDAALLRRFVGQRDAAAGASLTSKLILTAMAFVMISVIGFGAFRPMPGESPQEPS